MPVIGLEPSCLLTLRDEFKSLMPGAETEKLADNALLFEEFLAQRQRAGELKLELKALDYSRALVHGHCHQKAFATMDSMRDTLALIPDLEVEVIDSSCCGMAGSFGYEAEHHEISMRMGELSLFPAVRDAAPDCVLVANGFSCRHQVYDGTGRQPIHIARVLQQALASH